MSGASEHHLLHRRPASMSASSIPSPPITPTSPVFQHRSPSSPDSQSGANLYQHLQRLHLTQQIRGSTSPTFRRSSPPNLASLGQQGCESPPQSYPNLLQNIPPGHHRSSPPPNFQNLQIIKEDSLDLDKSSQSESEEDMLVQENGENADATSASQRAFTSKPQISITDTHGHVTAVTSDGDSESEKGDNSDSASVSPNSPSSIPMGIPFNYNSSLPYGNHCYTNLANIPRETTTTCGPTQDLCNTSSNVNCLSHQQQFYLQTLQSIQNTTNLPNVGVTNYTGKFSAQHSQSSSPGSWEINSEGMYGKTASDWLISTSNSQSSGRTDLNGSASSLQMGGECELTMVGSYVNVSSKRSVEDILNDIRKILEQSGPQIAYKCSENRFQLANSDVSMEVEVCEGVDASRLQVRRISGDQTCYQQLCQELLAGINI